MCLYPKKVFLCLSYYLTSHKDITLSVNHPLEGLIIHALISLSFKTQREDLRNKIWVFLFHNETENLQLPTEPVLENTASPRLKANIKRAVNKYSWTPFQSKAMCYAIYYVQKNNKYQPKKN